ncbi:ATP-grasp domain-containing protein [Pseudonocardia sp. Ae150A_Ps1]|uniref:ATP-grasp domain-containing protein n=2 Tax=Pseudonocardia TaxID=1847 RepID=UPI000AE97DAB|nr:ATP-grasp domain-containing protein [Pseudonocardia sp. Ae150A_Ps1]
MPLAQDRPAVLLTTDLVVLCRHLNLIAEIRTRGYEPVVVLGPETSSDELTRRRADPTHALHDAVEIVHLPDYSFETLLTATTNLGQRVEIGAVLNCGELFVDSAGALAEALGLPGPGGRASRIARNKPLQRLSAPGLAPRWLPLGPGRDPAAADDWQHYPAVLKPVGRMSSSGVRAINSPADLSTALQGYPAGEFLLLEQRVGGPEFSVESLVHDGEVVWADVTAKTTNESTTSYFTETGHVSPAAALNDVGRETLLDANTALLAAMSFGTGMSHAEFRLSDDGGRAVLMEVAARPPPPGDAIMRLWQLSSGAAIEPDLVDLALGRRIPPRRTRRRWAQQVYLDHRRGRLRDVLSDEAPVSWITDDDPPRLCAVVVTRSRGEPLGLSTDPIETSPDVTPNAHAVARILDSEPVLTDVAPAGEVVPGMTPNTILISGAPLPWEAYTGGQRRAIVGAAVFEGLAADEATADALLNSGDIVLEPCHDHGAVGSLTGVTTWSMPVVVVRDETQPGHPRTEPTTRRLPLSRRLRVITRPAHSLTLGTRARRNPTHARGTPPPPRPPRSPATQPTPYPAGPKSIR